MPALGRARPFASLAVVAALVAGFATAPSGPARASTTDDSTTATATPTAGAVTAVAAPENSGVIGDDADLSVRVTVQNGSADALTDTTARLHFDAAPLPGPDAVRAWLSADSAPESAVVATVPLVDIEPGATGVTTLAVPAEAIDLAAQFGVRAAGVTIVTASGDVIAHDRTAIVGQPAGTTAPGAGLVVIAPLIAPDARGRFLDAGTLTRLTAPGGPVTRALDAADTGAVALGIDPRIIASTRLLGEAAPEGATAALQRLTAAGPETFALRWSDADPLAAVGTLETASPLPLGAGSAVLGDDGAATATLDQLSAWPHTLSGWVWPADSTMSAAAVAPLVAEGTSSVLTHASDVVGGTGLLRSLDPQLRAVVSDPVATAAVRAASGSTSLHDRRAAVAELSALLASAPALSSPLVALAERDTAPTPQMTALIEDTLALPWARTGSLGPATSLGTVAAEARVTDDNRVDTPDLATLLEIERGDAEYARIAVDPQPLIADRRLDLLDAIALGGESISAGEGRYRAASERLRSSVQVVESVTINLLAERTSLPVTVQNALPVPVRVYVAVEARTGQLRVENPRVDTTIPPDSQVRALVPVQSLVNGEVDIRVSVRAGDGAVIGTPIQVPLNLQAGWETTGTIAIGAVIAALFALGLVRDIRRRRQQRAAPSAPPVTDAGSSSDEMSTP